MKYWYFKINSHRLRMEAKGRKPAVKQIGDKAWQIGRAIIMENDGRLERL